jgi:hypothetical protein
MHFAPDITTRIKQDFVPLDVQPVTELLIEFQDGTRSGDRILRCLLYVARGRFNYRPTRPATLLPARPTDSLLAEQAHIL